MAGKVTMIDKILADLWQIESVAELRERLGDLTEEEEQLVASLDLSEEPDEEERETLGSFLSDEFVESLIDKTLLRIRLDGREQSGRKPTTFDLTSGLTLLRLLSEIESRRSSTGKDSGIDRSVEQVAETVTDLWMSRVKPRRDPILTP